MIQYPVPFWIGPTIDNIQKQQQQAQQMQLSQQQAQAPVPTTQRAQDSLAYPVPIAPDISYPNLAHGPEEAEKKNVERIKKLAKDLPEGSRANVSTFFTTDNPAVQAYNANIEVENLAKQQQYLNSMQVAADHNKKIQEYNQRLEALGGGNQHSGSIVTSPPDSDTFDISPKLAGITLPSAPEYRDDFKTPSIASIGGTASRPQKQIRPQRRRLIAIRRFHSGLQYGANGTLKSHDIPFGSTGEGNSWNPTLWRQRGYVPGHFQAYIAAGNKAYAQYFTSKALGELALKKVVFKNLRGKPIRGKEHDGIRTKGRGTGASIYQSAIDYVKDKDHWRDYPELFAAFKMGENQDGLFKIEEGPKGNATVLVRKGALSGIGLNKDTGRYTYDTLTTKALLQQLANAAEQMAIVFIDKNRHIYKQSNISKPPPEHYYPDGENELGLRQEVAGQFYNELLFQAGETSHNIDITVTVPVKGGKGKTKEKIIPLKRFRLETNTQKY